MQINTTTIKNHKKLIFLGILPPILVITAIISFFIGGQKNTDVASLPNPQITNKQNLEILVSTIKFTGKPIEIPEKLYLYKQTSPSSLETIKLQLTQKLSLTPHEQIEDLWLSGDKNTTLSHDKNRQIITITYTPTNPNPTRINLDTATKTALELINSLGLNNSPTTIINTQLFSGGIEVSRTKNISEATFVLLSFGQQIDGFPVYFDSQNSAPINIYINNSYEVLKIEITKYSLFSKTNQQIKSLEFEEVIRKIENNEGEIITTSYEDFLNSPTQTATLDQVKIEYRYSTKLDLFIPYYRFSGFTNNNQSEMFEIIFPAVEVQPESGFGTITR